MATIGRRVPVGVATLATTMLTFGCGGSASSAVVAGVYQARVPTDRQLELDVDDALPGGTASLRDADIDLVVVEVGDREVTFRLDGVEAARRTIAERVDVTDREGSGPFKATRQIIVLDDGPLALGQLRIVDPVIWPGSFDGSPVITIKSRDTAERGPGVSCGRDEACLLVSSGVEPLGRYADANDPERHENPIDTIEISAETIEFGLDDGGRVSIQAAATSNTDACGLDETSVWDVPTEVGLELDEPVMIHTLCPSVPGAAIQLVIMGRSEIPALAPLTEQRDGDWCRASATCLVFVPA